MLKTLNIIPITMVLFFVIFTSFYSCAAKKPKIDHPESITSEEAYTEVVQLIKEINRKLCFEKIGIYTARNKTVPFLPYKGLAEITNPVRSQKFHEYRIDYNNFHNEKFKLEKGTLSDVFIYNGANWEKTHSDIGTYEFHFYLKNFPEDEEDFLTVSVNVNAKYQISDADKNCNTIIEEFRIHDEQNKTVTDLVSMFYKLPKAEPEKMVLTEEQQKEVINAVRGVLEPKSASKPDDIKI